MSNKIISIIIPIYDVEDYIEECLASVAAQTYTGPVECILVDDCSPDRSMERATRFINAYTGHVDFRTIHHKHNSGLSAARNTGTDFARGEWIWFVDSDDTLPPDALQIMMNAAAACPETHIIAGHFRVFGKLDDIPYKENDGGVEVAKGKAQVRRLLFDFKKSIHSVWTKLVRRDALGSLRFCPGILCEDEEWNFRLIMQLDCAVLVRSIVYNYRVRANSIMTDKKKSYARNNDILLSFMKCAASITGPQKSKQIRWMLYQILELDYALRWNCDDNPPHTDRHLRAAWLVVRRLKSKAVLLHQPALWLSLILLETEFCSGITMKHPLFSLIHRASKLFSTIYKR